MIFKLTSKGFFVIYSRIELQDAIGLQIKWNDLEIQVVWDKVIEELNISGDIDWNKGDQDNQLHRTDHAPESADDEATILITEKLLQYNVVCKA